MKISIGIMTWNEAGSIGLTIASIFRQRLLTEECSPISAVEIICLANGCTDGSASIADEAFRKELAECPRPTVTARVEELDGPNRAATWNQFVHHLADPQSEYFVFMDADVLFDHPDAIGMLVRGLHANPHAHAAGSRAIKDIAVKPEKSLADRFSLLMTNMTRAAQRNCLTGGFYCGRSAFWRRIELPLGMQGDDAFLTRMVVTSLFTHDLDFSKIQMVSEATFIFEAYTRWNEIFRQHRRRIVGRYIESLIYDRLTEDKRLNEDGADVLRRLNSEDPAWLVHLLREKTTERRWLINPGMVFVRMTQLAYQPFHRAILRFPAAVAATAFQMAVAWAANRSLRSGRFGGVWQDMRNRRLIADSAVGSPADADSEVKETIVVSRGALG